eukprot:TRINITY_DN15987_c2_g1_i1.p1 TRINITY_DN15987_c2_g1~~TRINITY_DN15987_c2_g1_i1.p1  ORF type:complete len:199 (+),score=13.94 TRINITY_DN15987_c2_g1_i1:49-645(+)
MHVATRHNRSNVGQNSGVCCGIAATPKPMPLAGQKPVCCLAVNRVLKQTQHHASTPRDDAVRTGNRGSLRRASEACLAAWRKALSLSLPLSLPRCHAEASSGFTIGNRAATVPIMVNRAVKIISSHAKPLSHTVLVNRGRSIGTISKHAQGSTKHSGATISAPIKCEMFSKLETPTAKAKAMPKCAVVIASHCTREHQ